MSAPIISVHGLGKEYRLGATLAHDTLRDHLMHAVKSLGRREPRRAPESFWALRDVSFDVQPGEVIGVIGRNGAGKSTLLKILSQITEPTTGEIRVRGRLASLLEVGTGFHPELTGRENIFLNGAILGMSKAEIKKKFDEIVAFAEVEKFLDTPVKRYSSGMYVRLAFAVAAHLEPEILVVDEVLAVGDAAFQNKCLGKMESVAKQEGRTVLFVSHNMTAVQVLCGRIIHLRAGRVAGIGAVDEQVRAYLTEQKEAQSSGAAGAALGSALELQRLQFTPNPVVSGDAVQFSLEIAAKQKSRLHELVVLIYSMYGVRVAILDVRQQNGQPYEVSPERPLRLGGKINSLPFVEGDYQIGLWIRSDDSYGDFFNLAGLTVLNQGRAQANVPYPAAHRGHLELDFTHEAINL
ncbi:MAG: ABC transporter ATP-binding protein [Verrucomicrobia bacterium]|nr:ABC transporter ATP-binding protein [Verrucomicrobiota bacterium]